MAKIKIGTLYRSMNTLNFFIPMATYKGIGSHPYVSAYRVLVYRPGASDGVPFEWYIAHNDWMFPPQWCAVEV